MKTREAVTRYCNLVWLSGQTSAPPSDWIFRSEAALKPEALAYRNAVYFDCVVNPLKDFPDDLPAPLLASSWRDCEADGLVEMGWFAPRMGPAEFWGIRLTKEGREALERHRKSFTPPTRDTMLSTD